MTRLAINALQSARVRRETLTTEAVNGRAGLALRRTGRAVAVVGVGTAGSKVIAVWIVLNPAKLGGWHRG